MEDSHDTFIEQCEKNLLRSEAVSTVNQLKDALREADSRWAQAQKKEESSEAAYKLRCIRRSLEDRIDDEGLDYQAVMEQAQSLLEDPRSDVTVEAIDGILKELNELLHNLRTDTIRRSLIGVRVELEQKKTEVFSKRVAALDVDIQKSSMIHKYDLRQFMARVEKLFEWYNDGSITYETYAAPYFPFVQSSGTGKTKILYEAQQEILKLSTRGQLKDPVTLCLLINCNQRQNNSSIFLPLKLPEVIKYRQPTNDQIYEIYFLLDKLLPEPAAKARIVLFFDESECLLEVRDAWHFRVVVRWLQIQRPEKVVAVFAGTNPALADRYPEIPTHVSSRDPALFLFRGYGRDVWPPFFELTTTGLGRSYLGCSSTESLNRLRTSCTLRPYSICPDAGQWYSGGKRTPNSSSHAPTGTGIVVDKPSSLFRSSFHTCSVGSSSF